MPKKSYILFLLLTLSAACNRPHGINRAFYYWKQRYQPTPSELQTLSSLRTQKLYVKMFDVSWDAEKRTAVPVAMLDQRAAFPDSLEFIPVVFLMNEVWQRTDSAWTNLLAQRTTTLLEQRCSGNKVKEVQVDCDWTRNSRDTYFTFLETLRRQPFLAGKKLSVTIRMHQIKYLASSGVPPADKGLLMCYNMGDLRKWGDHNSILNMETLQAYTNRNRIRNYPLSLDLALPLFEWSVLFRNKTYAGILRNMNITQLENTSLFRHDGVRLYTALKDTTLNGYTLRQNDVIRFESCSPELLEQTARYLSRQRQAANPTIIFYHLDSLTLGKYNPHELEKIYHILE